MFSSGLSFAFGGCCRSLHLFCDRFHPNQFRRYIFIFMPVLLGIFTYVWLVLCIERGTFLIFYFYLLISSIALFRSHLLGVNCSGYTLNTVQFTVRNFNLSIAKTGLWLRSDEFAAYYNKSWDQQSLSNTIVLNKIYTISSREYIAYILHTAYACNWILANELLISSIQFSTKCIFCVVNLVIGSFFYSIVFYQQQDKQSKAKCC